MNPMTQTPTATNMPQWPAFDGEPQPIYSLSGIKTFRGREGHGFNANITLNGKRVGEAIDDGNGGMIYTRFTSREDDQAFEKFVAEWYEREGRARHAKQMKEWDIEDTRERQPCEWAEDWINMMFARVSTIKDITRWAKTKTIFMLEGDKAGEYRTLTKPYSAAAALYIREKYGDKVKGIFNPADPTTLEALID